MAENGACGKAEEIALPRFVFLSISSFIAFVGACANLLLAYIFCTRRCSNTPPTLYPTVLAIADFMICTVYIMIFGVDATIHFYEEKTLFEFYHVYIIPAFVVSRITQLAIPYLLIMGTLERFVWISGKTGNPILRCMYSTTGRHVTMITLIVCCIVLRIPIAFATTVKEFPHCKEALRRLSTERREWAEESEIYRVFDFHILTITQTVAPFIVLIFFNMIIVKKLRKDRKESRIERISCIDQTNRQLSTPLQIIKRGNTRQIVHPPTVALIGRFSIQYKHIISNVGVVGVSRSLRNMTAPVRNAIYTMLAIVTSYLVSNILALILTVIELYWQEILIDANDPQKASAFHTIFSDTVSFVYMFTSAIRIVIYYLCNPKVRKDLTSVGAACFFRDEKPDDLPAAL